MSLQVKAKFPVAATDTVGEQHCVGSEKIAISTIKAECPSVVTEDVSYLLALRFAGKMPFVGYRDRFILHVLFIDRNHEVY